MIDQNTKEQIRTELDKYVSYSGSQLKASKTLDVSNAYISQVLAGKSDALSDAMWNKIAKNLGMRTSEAWQHADTKPTLKIMSFFNDARLHANVFALVCTPGSGKTHTLEHYVKTYDHVFYVKCERHMTERDVLRALLSNMGRTVKNNRVTDHIQALKYYMDRYANPLIILDEIEKVKPEVMLLLIDLYNALYRRCGIVIIGTYNLRDRIETGYKRDTLGYNEIYSRLGGKIIEIPQPDEKDAAEVVRKNGITDPFEVAAIVNDSIIKLDKKEVGVVDMRRVERLVHATKQRRNAA